MSRIDFSSGQVLKAHLRLHLDGTWSLSYTSSNRQFLSHPFSGPLSIGTLDIGSLRCEYAPASGSGPLTLVTVKGESGLHLFKQATGDEASPEDIYHEFAFMADLPKSPYLLRPTAAVVDEFGFRGFLLPYQPASSLNMVFSDYMDVVLHGPDAHASQLMPLREGKISWQLKALWASDIIKALCWLHERDIFWGDLKIENIVLCTDGCCRFIDYFPSHCTFGSAPPEFNPSLPITPIHDIFSLGLVLWCVAHEIGSFEREQHEGPHLIWGQGVPTWYRDIVDKCVEGDPQHRPNVNEVYTTFTTYVE